LPQLLPSFSTAKKSRGRGLKAFASRLEAGAGDFLAGNAQRTACETDGCRFCHFVGWQKSLLPAFRTDAKFAFLVPGRDGLMATRNAGLRVGALGLHRRNFE
jgi:hypothetical protein